MLVTMKIHTDKKKLHSKMLKFNIDFLDDATYSKTFL